MKLLVALLLLAAAQPDDVVVTARSLSDLERAWRECLTRGCPAKVEMDRAIELAEAQLVAGRYTDSWSTLRTTKRRNLKHADALPIEVARIARASSRLADLNGDTRIARINAFETGDALRTGLGSEDARLLIAKLDIADAYLLDAKYDFALAKYERVAREAKRKSLPAVTAEADYRRASLLVALFDRQPMYRGSARSAIARIVDSADPAATPYRDIARLTALNLLPERDQPRALDALLPTLTPRPVSNLLLVSSPPIDFGQLVVVRPAREAGQQWLDLRYRITREGRVTEVTPVREGPHLDPVLRDAAATALGERRYAPLALAADDPGPTRYVRYTFVFDLIRETGSMLPVRKGVPRVDSFDLGTQLVRSD